MAKARLVAYELGECRLWYLRAIVHREQGRYQEATRCAERCLGLAARVGTTHDRVLALWELVYACRHQEAAVRVRARVREGIEICRRRGERLLEAYLQLSLDELSLRTGHPVPLAPVRSRLNRAIAEF